MDPSKTSTPVLEPQADEPAEHQRFRGIKHQTNYLQCLIPLLDSLNWTGNERDLVEALPVDTDSMDRDGFLTTMANLNYGPRVINTRLNRFDLRLLPCLYIPKMGSPMVIIRGLTDGYMVFDGDTGRFRTLPITNQAGTIIYFKPAEKTSSTLLQPQKYWFWKVISRFKNLLVLAALLTLVLTLFSFITPLFIMAIYDQVLTSETGEMLTYLGIGILIFVFGDIGFRLIRSYLFSFISVRLGNIAGNEILRRILYLPAEYTESTSTGSQLSRIKDFDSIQGFFSGQPILALYDLPFTLLLIIGLVGIGGNLALVPITSVLLFIVFFGVTRPFMQRAVEEASTAGSKRHEFFIDFLTSYRAVKLSGNPVLWNQRFREISSDAVMKSYAIVRITAVINTGTQFLVTATGLATMTVGIFKVLNNEMSSGALMASILLVWRVLAPLRSGFGVLNQVGKIQRSVGQIDRLMNMKLEKTHESKQVFKKQIEGSVKFSQVSMRYSADSNPALLGVNFQVNKGEILAITGPDGTGKTTILKLLMGLFQPQSGQVVIGNMNVRQLDPIILRHSISYASQNNEFFDGTVAENLLLAKPEATDHELQKAAEVAGILEDIEKMENTFETVIKARTTTLDRSFIKRLGLAQMFLRHSSLYLIDEPERGLDKQRLKVILDEVEKRKDSATFIIVSKNRDVLQKADQILWLENNRVKMYGSAGDVLKSLDNQQLIVN